ncbi:MAG: hypothetical protein O9332_20605 [Microcystis sp. LE19-10.1B]|nr:hypothetical protein [Microcystis sp. LE19-10.1B]MCZ8027723.1 hypothetical protein [Microcystis sp. LE19-10.1B]
MKIGKTLHPTCPPDVGGVGGATPYPHRKTFCRRLYLGFAE